MAKSLKMRPSWICLKLCGGDSISATVLAEVLYRANVTKFFSDQGPVVVFSYEEWADNIGMSINQVRKALKRLSLLKLVSTFNDFHPFKKNVLRALHVIAPQPLVELNYFLVTGGYKYDGDVLCLSADGASDIRLHPAKSTSVCDTGISPQDTPVCVGGTDLHIDNKKTKKDLSAEIAETDKDKSFKENQQKEEIETLEPEYNETGSSVLLMSIPTMSEMLIALHTRYLEHHKEKLIVFQKQKFGPHEAGKFWATALSKYHSTWTQRPLKPKDYYLLGRMVLELGEEGTAKIIEGVIAGWEQFAKCVLEHEIIFTAPNLPDVGFLYYYRRQAVHIYLYANKTHGEYKVKIDDPLINHITFSSTPPPNI